MVGAGQNSNILHFNTIEDMNKYNISTTNIGDKAFVYDIDNSFYSGIYECDVSDEAEGYNTFTIDSIRSPFSPASYEGNYSMNILNNSISIKTLKDIRTCLQNNLEESVSGRSWRFIEKVSDKVFSVYKIKYNFEGTINIDGVDYEASLVKDDITDYIYLTDYLNCVVAEEANPEEINIAFNIVNIKLYKDGEELPSSFVNENKSKIASYLCGRNDWFTIHKYTVNLNNNIVTTMTYTRASDYYFSRFTVPSDSYYICCDDINFRNKELCCVYLDESLPRINRPLDIMIVYRGTSVGGTYIDYFKIKYKNKFILSKVPFTADSTKVTEGWFYGSNGVERGEMMNNKSYSQEDINKFRDRVNTYYEIEGMNKINTSTLNNCVNYFINCHNLTIAPNFDTSNVTNMSNMFKCCNNLIAVPNYNTANVTNMTLMFGGIWNIKNNDSSSYCNNLVTVPNFNTINVTTMQSMFYGCRNLVTVPNFDTSNVTGMYGVFDQCYNLISVPNFNMSKVTTIANMFSGCTNLTTIPNFDTSNVTNMWYAFYNCKSLTSVPNLNYSKLNYNNSSARCMFANCTNLVSNGVINTLNLPNYNGMFVGCSLSFLMNLKLKPNISISEFFAYRKEETIDMSLFSNANINNTNSWYRLFYLSVGLKNVTNVNSNNIVNMYWMFHECHNLISAPVMNTSKVASMGSMFYGCRNLIDVPQYNTANVTNMYCTFYSCNNLSDASIQNIINMCLNANNIPSNKRNLSTSNTESPFTGTNITNLRYQNRLSELTAKGWSY